MNYVIKYVINSKRYGAAKFRGQECTKINKTRRKKYWFDIADRYGAGTWVAGETEGYGQACPWWTAH